MFLMINSEGVRMLIDRGSFPSSWMEPNLDRLCLCKEACDDDGGDDLNRQRYVCYTATISLYAGFSDSCRLCGLVWDSDVDYA